MLTSIDEDGKLVTIFTSKIKEASDEVKKLFDIYEAKPDKQYFDWEKAAEDCGIASNALDDYFEKYDENNRSLETYNQYLKDQSKGLDLATIKTKGLAIAQNLLLNAAIAVASALVAKGIEWVIGKIDEAIITTEEYREKLSELKSESSSIESELSSLNDKLQTITILFHH